MSFIDSATLIASGRDLKLPASLQVNFEKAGAKQSLELLSILRVLPRRRVVALARWHGRTVVAKLFFARGRWQQHLQRERHGITNMVEAGITTPALVDVGSCTDNGCGVLLMQYVENAESLGERWQRADREARAVLLQRAVALIAHCHARGLVQKDIHLDNFLLQGDTLFLLDAAAIEKQVDDGDGVGSVRSLDNLAMFFAQFPAANDSMVPVLYEHYRARRPNADISADIGVFAAMLRSKRRARLKLIIDKLYRETSAHICRRSWRRFVVYRREIDSPQLRAFIDNPDDFISRGRYLKQGNSSTVSIVEIDGVEYVAKRYNIKSLWHAMRRMFRRSRAWVSWRNAHMLEMLGIATPKPVLMLERQFGSLRSTAYFLCEYVEGVDALQVLNTVDIDSEKAGRILQRFRSLFQVMMDYRIVHGDMKATNFLVTDDRLLVLDLDAMRQESDKRRFKIAFGKDMTRFADNWQDRPDVLARVNEMATP